MSSFYIKVHSGLGNKIIPLLSILRIAQKENKKVNCYWSNLNRNFKKLDNTHFLKLFEPINNINFINGIKYNKIKNSNTIYLHTLESHSIKGYIKSTKLNSINKNKIIVVENIVHYISLQNEIVFKKYDRWPLGDVTKSDVIKEICKYAKKLKPLKDIQNKIDNIVTNLNIDKIKYLGVHVRVKDGGHPKNNVNTLINKVQIFLNKNPDWKIYLATDSLDIEKKICNKFPNKVCYMKNPFGKKYKDKVKNNLYGLKNAICELFILSKCNKLLGTKKSSFSVLAWLLSNLNELMIWG